MIMEEFKLNYNKNIAKIIFVIAIIILAMMSLQGTFAADQTINNGTTGGIAKGITDTGNGETLHLQPGTYNKLGNDTNITINKNITLRGNGSADNVKIDANGQSRIF